MRGEERNVLIWAIVLSLVALVSVLLVDHPLAAAIHRAHSLGASVLQAFIGGIETVFGFSISKWLTGVVLIAAGLLMFISSAHRAVGWIFLFFGATQLTTRLVAGVLKNVFLRPRPLDAIASGVPGQFFTSGGSFPSGHAAHFWPLFFAAVIAVPRLRWPALVLAAAVSLSRVLVNDHYLSDVLASAAIAAFVALGYARLFRSRLTASRARAEGGRGA